MDLLRELIRNQYTQDLFPVIIRDLTQHRLPVYLNPNQLPGLLRDLTLTLIQCLLQDQIQNRLPKSTIPNIISNLIPDPVQAILLKRVLNTILDQIQQIPLKVILGRVLDLTPEQILILHRDLTREILQEQIRCLHQYLIQEIPTKRIIRCLNLVLIQKILQKTILGPDLVQEIQKIHPKSTTQNITHDLDILPKKTRHLNLIQGPGQLPNLIQTLTLDLIQDRFLNITQKNLQTRTQFLHLQKEIQRPDLYLLQKIILLKIILGPDLNLLQKIILLKIILGPDLCLLQKIILQKIILGPELLQEIQKIPPKFIIPNITHDLDRFLNTIPDPFLVLLAYMIPNIVLDLRSKIIEAFRIWFQVFFQI